MSSPIKQSKLLLHSFGLGVGVLLLIVYTQRNSTDILKVKQVVKPGKKAKRLPNCLIIGAKKGGTKALVDYLNIHPDIVTRPKECKFFENDQNYEKGLTHYKQQMPPSYPNQVVIEKTPGYLVSEKATRRIHRFNKSIKLIVTLRNPVTRVVSDYEHLKRQNKVKKHIKLEEKVINSKTGSVVETCMAINISMYYIHMKRWLDYFPQNQIHVVDGDNLILNPVVELEKIETFLGLRHSITKDKVYFDKKKGFYCMIGPSGRPECLSENKGHVHEPIDVELNKTLVEFFEPFNKKLYQLLGRTFNW